MEIEYKNDLHKYIVETKTKCQSCNRMWFNLEQYSIELSINTEPNIYLDCKYCDTRNVYPYIPGICDLSHKGDKTMCYTGKCKYEDYMGECTISNPSEHNDADCIQQDLYILEEEMLNDYYKNITGEKLAQIKLEEDFNNNPFDDIF